MDEAKFKFSILTLVERGDLATQRKQEFKKIENAWIDVLPVLISM